MCTPVIGTLLVGFDQRFAIQCFGEQFAQLVAETAIQTWINVLQVDYSAVARKYAATLSTSATSYVVTHNLGTRDVQVQVTEVGSPYGTVVTAWEATSANTITVYFATAPSANQYRVSVMG